MTYREPLPEGCPPDEAEIISRPRTVFRLVRNNPPTYDDFRSQRAEKPGYAFRGASECLARGLSVNTTLHDIEPKLKLPRFRGMLVCRIELDGRAGRIQQTGTRSHHTWWPFADFDILGNCTLALS